MGKESNYLSPILHPIWDALLERTLHPKNKKTLSLFELWTCLDGWFLVFVSDCATDLLFTSTHERKYLGFQLFQKLLPSVPASSVSLLFTPNFLRCLMNSLSSKDTYLFKIARQTADCISKTAQTSPETAFDMVLQLIGPQGNLHFDVLSKTKTVETILHALTSEQIQKYIDHLQSTFMNQDQRCVY